MQTKERKKKPSAKSSVITFRVPEDLSIAIASHELPGDTPAETLNRILRRLSRAIADNTAPVRPIGGSGISVSRISFRPSHESEELLSKYADEERNASQVILSLLRWGVKLPPPQEIAEPGEIEQVIRGAGLDRILVEDLFSLLEDRSSRRGAIDLLLRLKDEDRVLLVDRVPSPTPRVAMGDQRVYAIVLLGGLISA